ncbi:MAG TPA: SBBP repeat-containing protein [Blastocatellia bacterium]|nr:SBBP repeat-containing protein [Blastocatellia bacterium]
MTAQTAAYEFCGYIGGREAEFGNGIAVDGAGNMYVAGWTTSNETSFPVRVGPDLTFNGASPAIPDAFVARVKADGSGLEYCGYIGGSDTDQGFSIAIDNLGAAYVTGSTRSTEATFPAVSGPDLTYNGGSDDAFVAKVKADGAGLEYCGSGLSAVRARIGGVDATVSFAGAQGDFVGLDQVNVGLPRSLAGRGAVDIVLMADGVTANTVTARVK